MWSCLYSLSLFIVHFFNDKPGTEEQNYASASYVRNYDFIGIVVSDQDEDGYAVVEQRNKMVIEESSSEVPVTSLL